MAAFEDGLSWSACLQARLRRSLTTRKLLNLSSTTLTAVVGSFQERIVRLFLSKCFTRVFPWLGFGKRILFALHLLKYRFSEVFIQKPAVPVNENQRLKTLENFGILDTLPEKLFDNIAVIASQICGTPIALVSLIDGTRQWFKAKVGLSAPETHRDISFCGHAITANDPVFEIKNSLVDPRFSDNPLAVGDPNVIFYAGAPLIARDGSKIGTLCVIDSIPRELSESQRDSLRALADQVMVLL
ncbi:MAG: GAF domain-containing protein, partial [Proteobacteria bacterium]